MTRAALDSRDLAALLDWYVESGVDLALDESPHDRYADSARAAAPMCEPAPEPLRTIESAPAVAKPAPRRTPVAAPDEAARAAAAEAAAARDLDDLAARLAAFAHAPFRDMATHFLFGAGAAAAPLIAFDSAPGAAEESTGAAFCGRRAQLLDNILAAIGRDRAGVGLAYLSPWRPPGDRMLSPQETAIFAPFARRRVELARPQIVLLFGEAPARAVVETREAFSHLRGKWRDLRCGDHVARALTLSALDAMLKGPSLKPAAWRALRAERV